MLTILNLGAGVQSTTLALMAVDNWHYWGCTEPLPYPAVGLLDYAIFADTQEEPVAVYKHLDWLESRCAKFFPILRRTAGKLGDELRSSERAAGIPAFLAGADGKMEGLIQRQCTTDYKVDVIERTIRRLILGLKPGQRVPSEAQVTQLMGLSYDEAGRIGRVKARVVGKPFEYRFPLFEMEMTRGSCKTWLKKRYPEREVPRSACVFCPYHSQAEWRAIREVQEDWDRACAVDRSLREADSAFTRTMLKTAYVHRSCVPLDQADLDDPEVKERKRGQEMFGFLQDCEGLCGV